MRGIEQVPSLYDPLMAALEAAGLGRWRAWLGRGARGRVLDLGCGTGRTLALLPPGVRPVGLDPCRASLLRARGRTPGAALVCGRAEQLPFRHGVFDTVVTGLVLCSVGDPAGALAEVARVLAPGGRVRLLEHVRARGRLGGWVQDRAQPFWTWLTGGCRPNRDTERAVEAGGFVIQAEGRRSRGHLRRFQASPPGRPHAEGDGSRPLR